MRGQRPESEAHNSVLSDRKISKNLIKHLFLDDPRTAHVLSFFIDHHKKVAQRGDLFLFIALSACSATTCETTPATSRFARTYRLPPLHASSPGAMAAHPPTSPRRTQPLRFYYNDTFLCSPQTPPNVDTYHPSKKNRQRHDAMAAHPPTSPRRTQPLRFYYNDTFLCSPQTTPNIKSYHSYKKN